VIVRDAGYSKGPAYQLMAESNAPYATYGNPSALVALAKLEGISPDSRGVMSFQVTDPSGLDVLHNLKWCAPNAAGSSSGLCDGQ
jgi:hypothetical protein